MTVRLVVFGRQGAGKGTQCVQLAERYGSPHISTGDMLRAAVAEGTEFGTKANEFMSAGDLVPDEVITGVVRERLAQDDAVEHGFILDGYPRTVSQAEALLDMAAVDMAINIDVPVEVVVERMKARGRDDDTEEAVRNRLDIYERETAPLLAWFAERSTLLEIHGVGTEDEVQARLVDVIETTRNDG